MYCQMQPKLASNSTTYLPPDLTWIFLNKPCVHLCEQIWLNLISNLGNNPLNKVLQGLLPNPERSHFTDLSKPFGNRLGNLPVAS